MLTNLKKRHLLKISTLNTSQSATSATQPLKKCLAHFAIEDCLAFPTTSLEPNVDMELSLDSSDRAADPQPLVLVVDDNEDNLMLLAFLIEQLNCRIITAANGQTALDLAQHHRPSLILLDMMLPDLDGMEVLSRLRQDPLTSMIPVIAVTAMARPEDRERILALGCNEYVSKPYAVDDLEVLLCQYLRK